MFTAEANEMSLNLMREGVSKALKDADGYSAELSRQALERARMYAQAASELAGSTVEAELERGSGIREEHWRLPAA